LSILKFLKQSNYETEEEFDTILIGKGFTIDDIKKENLIEIRQKNSNRKGHTLVFGTTRVGKTRLVENMAEQDIEYGHNVVIFDPKLDVDLFSNIYSTAVENNRKEDFILLSTVFPDFSIQINPLSHFFMVEEIVNNIMSGVPADDQFFYDTAFRLASVIIRSIIYTKQQENMPLTITYKEIAHYSSHEKLSELRDAMSQYNDKEANLIVSLADAVLETGAEYFSKVSSTLQVTLAKLSMGSIAKVLSNTNQNEIIERLEHNKGLILYIQTGALLQGDASSLFGKIIISMFQNLIGRVFASGKKLEVPLCIYLDEMSNLLYHGIEDMFNKAGGANCYITGLTQSPADISAVVGEEKARKIFDNTNTKIIMRMNDIESAKLVVDLAGEKIRNTTQITSTGTLRSTEVKENVLNITDVTRLNAREFYYFGFEGVYFGKTAPVVDKYIKINFPKTHGLSKELNNNENEEDN